MKRFIILVILLNINLIFLAWGSENKKVLDFYIFSVPKKLIPSSMMLYHVPYGSSKILKIRNDLITSIKDKEIKYSWNWMRKVPNPKIYSGSTVQNIYFISNVGEYGDDAAVMKWDRDGYDYEVIDSRFLTFTIHNDSLANMNTENIFKIFVNRCDHTDSEINNNISVEKFNLRSKEESYGKIIIDCKKNKGWFLNPIEWYRNNNYILFVFDKVLNPPASKAPLDSNPLYIVGGSSLDDRRPYLKFEKSNREELAKEYFKKIKKRLEKQIENENADQEAHKSENRFINGLTTE